ncbi:MULTISPECIES: ABC transporter permease [unclassified Devosia]|jgi:peptide/nickel transport system permease protein|uniref:ABC transporter permease n=1 Tax=unclassified Devosia TaxID=196773 RepID=UPI00145CC5DD|nr:MULTISPECIES: ABC transporter permease [unclassified Devosia]MBJ6988022.1 ABC transporter permease [Devosia sp. MC521]MBJ7578453.1 ABC transporter permease [Devosia sp. MC532]MBK1794753.1 ABC transporter permease [Devosia sp. WQ 349K1]QMW62094.1 ABC transporter permease [Devosia sp. MC521]
MPRYILTRIAWGLLTLLAILTFVFFLARMTGDPVRLLLPDQATQADVDAMRETLGLNRPVVEQYFDFMAKAVTGDLGDSLRQQRPALEIVLERLPATLELAITSFVIGFAVALLLAVLGEVTGNRRLRNGLLWVATFRQSVPPYLFGILLILILSVNMGVLPAIGRNSTASYVIPVLTMATFEIALYLRLFNTFFDEMRRNDWVRTAIAKGISRNRLVFRHMLPNAILPVITVAGINLGILIGGTVVLEMVFNWPGMGRLIVQGVTQRDYPIVQAGVVVTAAVFILINIVVDILYAVLDPRVRLS